MEKLNLEVTVVVTEKLAFKKELDRVDGLLRTLQRDYKQQRANYDLLVDENTKVGKQNNMYRGLIRDNENKLAHIGKEIYDL